MDPLAYLKALRQWWWLPVLCVAVAASVAFVTSPEPDAVEERVQRDTVYQATHTLVRDDMESMPISFGVLDFMIDAGEFPERLANRLDHDGDAAALVDEFDVKLDNDLGTMQISSTQETPEQAEEWADTFADEVLAFLDEIAEDQREVDIAEAHEQRDRVEARLNEVEAAIESRGGPEGSHSEIPRLLSQQEVLLNRFARASDQVDTLELDDSVQPGLTTLRPAVAQPRSRDGGAPLRPSDDWGTRTAAASAVGLVLGLAVVLVIDRLDTRVRTRRAAEEAFDLPVIAEIPKLRWPASKTMSRIIQTQPESDTAEAFRMVRLSLQMMDRRPDAWANGHADAAVSAGFVPPAPANGSGGQGMVVLVTSPSGHDGKTSVVANLAGVFAEMGRMVLCVDCDLRNPQLHNTFGLPDGPGITDALADRGAPEGPARMAVETGTEGVWLLRAGSGAAQPWLAPQPDRHTLAQLRKAADVILIDSGPLLAVNDPSTLMPAADAVVVIARAGRITVEGAHRTRELLHRIGAPALGLVFNAVPTRHRTAARHSSSSSTVATSNASMRRLLRWWLKPAKEPTRAKAAHAPKRLTSSTSGSDSEGSGFEQEPSR